MKIRFFPLLLSLSISFIVIFGGWFVYQSAALKNPLSNTLSEIEGITHYEADLQRNQAHIELTLSSDANLREIMHKINDSTASIIDNRELHIKIVNASSDELDRWWSNVLFDVAQAMESRVYGDIPHVLEQAKAQLTGLEYVTEMDEQYVYIQLQHEEYSKFIMLPRTPVQLGVWSND